MLFGGAIIGLYLDYRFFRNFILNLYFHIMTLLIGIPLMYFVLLVSRNTGRFLSKMGRVGDIPRLDTNKLVTTGMYSCMRHPMHFGLLFFPLSIALIIGSPSFILIVSPLEMLFMIFMIKFFEEPEAIKKFGEAYVEYKSKVPMFNLHPSCISRLIKGFKNRR
ncbi:MAG TPA: isoprenylcysteine carboxylmethyltransferase family protein [Thermoplasmatales archaeon]|nr:isoprenylcysteine carboxylmethyltransferase family protein [Thermoplasmatales archaeon]